MTARIRRIVIPGLIALGAAILYLPELRDAPSYLNRDEMSNPSPQTDQTIERMLSSGELRYKTLVTAPDGTSRFWILETGARAAVTAR